MLCDTTSMFLFNTIVHKHYFFFIKSAFINLNSYPSLASKIVHGTLEKNSQECLDNFFRDKVIFFLPIHLYFPDQPCEKSKFK